MEYSEISGEMWIFCYTIICEETLINQNKD